MDVYVALSDGFVQRYGLVSRMHIDRQHNLRLYTRTTRGLFGTKERQFAFHPAGEWLAVGPGWDLEK